MDTIGNIVVYALAAIGGALIAYALLGIVATLVRSAIDQSEREARIQERLDSWAYEDPEKRVGR